MYYSLVDHSFLKFGQHFVYGGTLIQEVCYLARSVKTAEKEN